MWAALFMAAIVAAGLLIVVVGAIERSSLPARMGVPA